MHVVEDVQWADRSTLDLLAFLATNLTDERVLVVLTHRTDAAADDPLVPWLAELGRLWPVERLPLDRLDRGRHRAPWSTQLRGERAGRRASLADVRGPVGGQPAVRRAAGADRRATGPAARRPPCTTCSAAGSASLPDDTRRVPRAPRP